MGPKFRAVTRSIHGIQLEIVLLLSWEQHHNRYFCFEARGITRSRHVILRSFTNLVSLSSNCQFSMLCINLLGPPERRMSFPPFLGVKATGPNRTKYRCEPNPVSHSFLRPNSYIIQADSASSTESNVSWEHNAFSVPARVVSWHTLLFQRMPRTPARLDQRPTD